MVTKIVIAGCCGKMGKRIAALALKDEGVKIAGAVEAKGHAQIGEDLGRVLGEEDINILIGSNLEEAAKASDAIIDFTTPMSTVYNLSIARKIKVPIVIGTTGLTDEEMKILKSTSSVIPVLFSANMSAGVNLLFRLAPELATALGDDYDIEIIESHHNMKKDSPSGTAKRIAELIAEAKGKNLKDIAVYGREGSTGERPKGQIGIHAVRAGNIVGEHTIIYAGKNEIIEITHRASSRDLFAEGALRAAKYIADKSPGLYNMQDVLEGV